MAGQGIYDNIISLGSNCAPASAIRKYFGTGVAYPFDWWICSLDQLVKAVDEKFENMFNREEIECYKVLSWSIRSRRYGIAYHHDFTRMENGQYDERQIFTELPSVAEKYRRRFERLHKCVQSSRTLFIRYGIDFAGRSEQDSVFGLQALLNGLGALWPNAEIEVLALASESPLSTVSGLDQRISLDWLGPPTGEMWREEQFMDIFRSRALSVRIKEEN